jgi:LEA14-like dessication related protein
MKLSGYRILICLLIFPFLFSGCSFFSALFGSKPEVTGIKNVSISGVSLSGVEFLATVEVTNDNNYNANVLSSSYEIYLNNSFIGKGSTTKSQTIHNNSVSYLDLPVRVNYLDLPSSAIEIVKAFISGQKLNCKVDGEVKVELDGVSVTVPIGVEKELKAML